MNNTVQTSDARTLCLNIELDKNAERAAITRAIKMIRGIVAVRPMRQDQVISPTLKRKITCAEKNLANGKVTKFGTVAEMDAYLSAL